MVHTWERPGEECAENVTLATVEFGCWKLPRLFCLACERLHPVEQNNVELKEMQISRWYLHVHGIYFFWDSLRLRGFSGLVSVLIEHLQCRQFTRGNILEKKTAILENEKLATFFLIVTISRETKMFKIKLSQKFMVHRKENTT